MDLHKTLAQEMYNVQLPIVHGKKRAEAKKVVTNTHRDG